MPDEQPRTYSLIARVRPHDVPTYLKYLNEVYYPGLATQKGFISLRVAALSGPAMSAGAGTAARVFPNPAGEFLRMSTWASKEEADEYLASDLNKSFSVLLDLAEVLDFVAADIKIDRHKA